MDAIAPILMSAAASNAQLDLSAKMVRADADAAKMVAQMVDTAAQNATRAAAAAHGSGRAVDITV
jgi:hypothetical protein